MWMLYVFGSFKPILTAMLVFFPSWVLVFLLTFERPSIRWGYVWLLSFYWFCAGIAALWDSSQGTPFTTFIDADFFYRFLMSEHIGNNLEEIRRRADASLAIIIWHWFYYIFQEFGLGTGAYIGIVVNIVSMAGTAVICAEMLRYIEPYDSNKILKLFLAFSLNGTFIIFVTIHIRDAFVCFAIALFSLFWVRYIANKSIINLLIVLGTSFLSYLAMRYLREEFQFLPVGEFGAAVASLMIARDGTRGQRTWFRIIGIGAALVLVVVLQAFSQGISSALTAGTDLYTEESARFADNNSLGMALVVNQPLPIRLIFGPPYSLLMPLPVWVGFESGTVYHIGKSLGAAFAYFFVPALIARIWFMVKWPASRQAAIVFLLAVFMSFLLAISITSLESRHVAAFMPLAIVAVLAGPTYSRGYQLLKSKLQSWFLIMIVGAHLVWVAVKII
jgi:hypothetical protein